MDIRLVMIVFLDEEMTGIAIVHEGGIARSIVVRLSVTMTGMLAQVGLVVHRGIVVEELPIIINRIDAEVPAHVGSIDRTIEILAREESAVLARREHVVNIVVAHNGRWHRDSHTLHHP